MKNRLDKICAQALTRYGVNDQLCQTQEECAELIAAISHYRRGRVVAAHLADEVADVIIMTEQVRQIMPSDVAVALEKKLDRLEGMLRK